MQLKSVQYDKPHFSHAGQCGIGEAWARIPPELDRAQRLRTAERIRALLHERDAVLVAHYYVDGELQDLARETGVVFVAAGHHATERYGAPAVAAAVAAQWGLEHRFIDIDNPA